MSRLKRSTLAGRWYPASPAALRAEVEACLAAAPVPAPAAPLLGLVVPHAGYMYSGRTAGAGYARAAATPYRRVVILAPSHYSWFRGLALPDVDAFETPLGAVGVDTAACARLGAAPLAAVRPDAFADEHALEIQLPFLQRTQPGAVVVPVLVGELAPGDAERLAAALAPLVDGDTLVVVSSDFVHYGRHFDYLPFPPAGAAAVRAGLRALDMGAIERVCAGDGPGFVRYVEETGATICGRRPIELFLALPPVPHRGELVAYATSLDVTGEYDHVVSYASIAFPRP